jgi:hypothetical protein
LSITNGWLAIIAIVIAALLLAVFVITIVTLAKVNRADHRPAGTAAQVDSETTVAMARVLESLKEENSSLKEQVQREESGRRSAESRAGKAETAAQSALSVTDEQIHQGVERARTKEFSQLQKKLRGAELHNMSLHQECSELRAKLAKTDKRAAATNADLTETEQLLDQASRRLGDANLDHDAAQREAATLKRELENLQPEPARTPTPMPKPKIVTRTTATATNGFNKFDEAEKHWGVGQDSELLTAYLTSRNLAATADLLRVDQKQVALRLVTLLLGPQGALDDPSAPKHGKTSSATDSKAIVQAWGDGRKLPAIARDFQRDQLGVGWKLLDDKSRPVELTAGMIGDIVDEAHR